MEQHRPSSKQRYLVHRCVELAGAYVYDNLVLKNMDDLKILEKYKHCFKNLLALLEKNQIKVIDLNRIVINVVKYSQFVLNKFPENIRKYMIRSHFNEKIHTSITINLQSNYLNVIRKLTDDTTYNIDMAKIEIHGKKITFTKPKQMMSYVPLIVRSSTKSSSHFMILIKSKDVWNLFDPNGNHSYYSDILTPKQYQKLINRAFSVDVNLLFHNPLNNTPQLNWFSYDKGLCGAWCILLVHIIHLNPDKYINELIDFLLGADMFTRGMIIYSYCCGIYPIIDKIID